jgi:hypothetical protein
LCADKRGLLRRTVALRPLAIELASAANGGGLFAGALLARRHVMAEQLHFAIDDFTLDVLVERALGLLDIFIANLDLNKSTPPLASNR